MRYIQKAVVLASIAAAFSASDDHDAALHIPEHYLKKFDRRLERLAIQQVSGVCS